MPSGGDKRKTLPIKLGHGKYELRKLAGAGCFGEVYTGVVVATSSPRRGAIPGEEIAAKCEDLSSAAVPQLEHESETLEYLQKEGTVQGFAKWIFLEKLQPNLYLGMEALGKSLEERLQECNGKFRALTTALIAEQVLHRIEYLHSKGIVHRDIKPENFMFGRKPKEHIVYLIDFGLSKKYYDKAHVEMRQKLSLTGTARYASINAHKGIEQSRRDDLEAIGHMFMYFLRGALPWSGLQAQTKQEKYRKICEKKVSTPLPDLCKGFPPQFMTYLDYARRLEFKERPKYDDMAGWMKQARLSEEKDAKVQEDFAFEWYTKDTAKWADFKASKMEPLVKRINSSRQGGYVQPDERESGRKPFKLRLKDFCTCVSGKRG